MCIHFGISVDFIQSFMFFKLHDQFLFTFIDLSFTSEPHLLSQRCLLAWVFYSMH